MITTKSTSIPDLHEAVAVATKRYEEAKTIADEAHRSAIALLAELNGAQHDLDVAVAALRKAAPGSSNWKNERVAV